MNVTNEGKLNDNKKSSSTDDNSIKFTIHCMNYKDDDGYDS